MNLGRVEFSVHEDNIASLTKFLTKADTRCTQWFCVKCREVSPEFKISRNSVREYEADFETISPLEKSTHLPYKVMSFDIEVFSSVPNRFPNALNRKDEVFAISVVVQKIVPGERANSSDRDRWCICRGDVSEMSPEDANDEDNDSLPYKVIKCDKELDIIEKFAELVIEEDPDILTGHNVWGFDMKFLYMRAVLIYNSSLPNMSRVVVGNRTELSTTERVSLKKQTMENHEFISYNLEEQVDDDEDIYPEQEPVARPEAKGSRKLTVNGVLTLSAPKTVDLYAKPCAPMETRHTSRSNVYSRNKIHSFVMEGRVTLDTLQASKEHRMDMYTLQHLCTTLMGKSKLYLPTQDIFKAFRLFVLEEPSDEDLLEFAETMGFEMSDEKSKEAMSEAGRSLNELFWESCIGSLHKGCMF